MTNEGPHNQYAARFTRQMNADAARQAASERIYGRPDYGAKGPSWITFSGWSGFGAVLGMAIGAISAHEHNMGSMTGGLLGAAAGAAVFFAISFVLGLFFKGINLGWTGIKMLLASLTGIGTGFASTGAFGGVPRATARGGAAGGVIGVLLALWLGEPVADAALRLSSFGAIAGAGWRIFRLTTAAMKRG
jgi:hypothetical protein